MLGSVNPWWFYFTTANYLDLRFTHSKPTINHHRTWNMDINFLKPLKAMNWGYLLTSNYHYLDLWRQKIEGVSSIRLVCISSLVCQPAEFGFIYVWQLAFILLVSSSVDSTWSSIIAMLPLSLFRSLQMICFRASHDQLELLQLLFSRWLLLLRGSYIYSEMR